MKLVEQGSNNLERYIEEMNFYMNRITKAVFSYFDTAKTDFQKILFHSV